MKTKVGLRRYKCVAGVTALLITIALIAALAGCGSAATPARYSLTISSTAGGSVTVPGEATYNYDRETVVNLAATPDANYRFVEWTGHVGTVADVNAASTTITVNGNYAITANFEAVTSVHYELSISSTTGGSVTTPGEGTFTYEQGTLVDLAAQSEEGYRFAGWTGDPGTIGDVNSVATTITMNGDYAITASFEEKVSIEPMVAAGVVHTVGLKSDGRVVAVGANEYGECDVGGWTNIIQVAAVGEFVTVGLQSHGTVVITPPDPHASFDDWTDIVQVAGGYEHMVGLKSDGTVVAVGPSPGSEEDYGQCNVGGWTDIVQVTAGYGHTVGLKSNGRVVAVGDDHHWQCNVGGWTDIIQIAAGGFHTVGLKSDGTLVAVGPPPGSEEYFGQCDVADWTDIVQVSAGFFHTVGVRADGTVVAVGPPPGSEWEHGQRNVGDWTDIIQVAAGGLHTVGLKSDGTVVAVGPPPGSEYDYGQCAVHGWYLGK